MDCVVCLLSGSQDKLPAKFVVNGYSVCDDVDEEHWNVVASATSYHDVVMGSRALT